MEYLSKNGKNIIIRKPTLDDAESLIDLITLADRETKFLSRNPDEFSVTVEQEREFIRSIQTDSDSQWFVAEDGGKIVGMASVGVAGKNERYRHRGVVTFVVLKSYWGMGIGRKLMQECIEWCRGKNITQMELDVVSDNTRAINLYEKFGFRTMGTIPHAMRYKDGTFADKKLMVLEL